MHNATATSSTGHVGTSDTRDLALTAYAPPVLAALETLIAPGGRARISPFIESAQFSVLFGEAPSAEGGKRYEHARQILDRNRKRLESIAHVWVQFTQRGKSFSASAYDEELLRAYLAYYLTTNVCKAQLVLLDLIRQECLSGSITVVDLGVGAGTTGVAVLDFMVAWANVCGLFGVPFPVQALDLIGLDTNAQCLGMAQAVYAAYGEALAQRGPTSSPENGYNGLSLMADWVKHSEWRQCDLNQSIPALPRGSVLLFASNVLNELDSHGRQNLQSMISALDANGVAIVIEPGDREKCQALNRWRRELLATAGNLASIAPCGAEHGARLPEACVSCWNSRRESLHQPLLYRRFREAAAALIEDQRPFDDYENKLLSWSYACIGRAVSHDTAVTSLDVASRTCRARYIGCFSSNDPVARCPDELLVSHTSNWKRYIKLCPGDTGNGLALVREPGMEFPQVRFGETITIEQFDVQEREQRVRLLLPRDGTRLERGDPSLARQECFLAAYSAQAQQAIDDLAYRLFGFPSMRWFQHRILERVLTGHSILGIAATGGGKSECFILPAMLLPGITIVVSPLNSLMQDQYDQRICERYGLGYVATSINGDVPFGERQARLKRMEQGYYKLIYFTPEQLERGYVLDSLKRADRAVGIRYIAFDEAHCISQWGHDFRPSYLNLVHRLRTWGINPVRIALTATASPEVRDDICEELYLDKRPVEMGGDVFVHSSNRPELNLIVRIKEDTAAKAEDIVNELRRLLQENRANDDPGAAIVFMPHGEEARKIPGTTFHSLTLRRRRDD